MKREIFHNLYYLHLSIRSSYMFVARAALAAPAKASLTVPQLRSLLRDLGLDDSGPGGDVWPVPHG